MANKYMVWDMGHETHPAVRAQEEANILKQLSEGMRSLLVLYSCRPTHLDINKRLTLYCEPFKSFLSVNLDEPVEDLAKKMAKGSSGEPLFSTKLWADAMMKQLADQTSISDLLRGDSRISTATEVSIKERAHVRIPRRP